MSIVSDSIDKIIKAGGLSDQFVNGGTTDVVMTDGGPIKTIAGIAAGAVDDILNSLTAQSNSTATAGLGTKTFLVGPGKRFKPGQVITATSGTIVLSGTVASYSQNTLIMSVFKAIGTGTAASWGISFAGVPGNDGAGGGGGTSTIFVPTLPWENP